MDVYHHRELSEAERRRHGNRPEGEDENCRVRERRDGEEKEGRRGALGKYWSNQTGSKNLS